MVNLKGKKKVKDDDEDFVVEDPHDEEDDNKKFELEFKSLRARTTVLPLYDPTQSLSPERKSKIREMGFASMLDFPFQKIPDKLPYFEVLGIPMGKNKLESDSPRDFNDEFLIAFKKKFEGKKINCDNTSRLKYHVIKNIKSSDIISDFDWEIFGMCQGKFGLVDVIEENEETENESEVEKQKLKVIFSWVFFLATKDETSTILKTFITGIENQPNVAGSGPTWLFDIKLIYEMIEAKFESVLKEKIELEDMLKENMEMHELFYEDEKFELFVKKFKQEFTTGLNKDENHEGISGARHGNDNDDVDCVGHGDDEDDAGHTNHGDVHENAAEEKEVNEASKLRQAAEKEAAKKEAAAKEKETEKISATK
uniref:Uncharacterized protein n=1 Tax=Tanacetum cinerariifolium TaxID=118510 RepID=A0A699GT19_TANCI|nr:hypothetical protein [Tanacetum cinerariifolium]